MAERREWVARLMSKGRVTIPVEVRRELGVRDGDSLIFRSGNGAVTIASPKRLMLAELLAGFDPAKHRYGPAERVWEDAPRGSESI